MGKNFVPGDLEKEERSESVVCHTAQQSSDSGKHFMAGVIIDLIPNLQVKRVYRRPNILYIEQCPLYMVYRSIIFLLTEPLLKGIHSE